MFSVTWSGVLVIAHIQYYVVMIMLATVVCVVLGVCLFTICN